jgi:hypothetical protein
MSNTLGEAELPARTEKNQPLRDFARPNSKQILLWRGAQCQEHTYFWKAAEVFGEALKFSKHKFQKRLHF